MRLALAALLIAAPVLAAPTPEQKFDELMRGRIAGKPVDCILPESAVRPEILDGRAIAYRAGPVLYVNRFVGGCPALRQDSQIRTSSIQGQLCRNDHFRVVSPAGGRLGDLCAFGPFTPYRRVK